MRPTYRDSELECYRIIVKDPGVTREQIILRTKLDETTVRKALLRLWEVGAVDRQRSQPGLGPYQYRAARGMEPFETHRRETFEQHRHRQVLDGRIPKRRGLHRFTADKKWLMTRAEWETLFVNYELMHPGDGDLIIYEHLNSRARRDEESDIGWDDVPRLMAEVDRRRRARR